MSNVTFGQIAYEVSRLRMLGFKPHTIEMTTRDANGLVASIGLPPAVPGAPREVYGMKIVERPVFVIHATPTATSDIKREVW